MKRISIILAITLTVLTVPPMNFGTAQDAYDRYGATLRPVKQMSGIGKAVLELLAMPFEIIRWPVDKTLMAVDEYHLDQKFQWGYEKLQSYGVTPRLSIVSPSGLGGGADVDLVRLASLKGKYPDLIAETWFDWTHDVYMKTGARLGWERIRDTGFQVYGIFNYQSRPEEHFYGIGPTSSAGEGCSYRMEETKLEGRTGYSGSYGLTAEGFFNYRNVNITNGRDSGRGIIDPVFFPQVIPGLAGDELVGMGFELLHDTRDQRENSTRGGIERFSLGYHEGVSGSDARYMAYEAEVSRFLSLGSKRRVLAFRFIGEHNDEINGGEVPFHQMAKLGGYGSHTRLSRTLRGYDFNRFFDESAVLLNLEYRYTVWEYKNFKMDSVIFWDEGQVFGEFKDFKLNRLKESYGLGARVSAADHVIFSVEVAHGDEGTNFYVKSSAPF